MCVCVCVCVLAPVCCMLCLVTQPCPTLQSHGLWPTRLLCSWGFSRQQYWSRLHALLQGNLPNSEIELRSPTLQADSLLSEVSGNPPLFPTYIQTYRENSFPRFVPPLPPEVRLYYLNSLVLTFSSTQIYVRYKFPSQ